MKNTLIRSAFAFLLQRAHRSRLAAAGAALLALVFGPTLMHRLRGRTIEGECRRVSG